MQCREQIASENAGSWMDQLFNKKNKNGIVSILISGQYILDVCESIVELNNVVL